METNKSVNRLFLITVIFYLAASFILGLPCFEGLSIYVAILISQALILIPALVFCKIKKCSIKELISFKKIKFSVGILIVICTYCMYPLMIVLNAITLFFVESGTAGVMDMATQIPFGVAALLIAGLPACAEEFMFRGVLFGTYRKSKIIPAIFLSAFLFGCMHMNFNQFLYTFVLGVYMAFLVEATGSILSSMLAHFVLNFTGVFFSFLLPKLLEKSGEAAQMPAETGQFIGNLDNQSLIVLVAGVMIWGIIAIGTTAAGVGIYIAIAKLSGRIEHIKKITHQGTKERLITVSVIVAIIISWGIMITQVI